VIGVLLILEVIGLVALGGYEFLQVRWRGIDLESLQHQAVEVAVFALFVPSAVLTLLSALSFLFLRRRGWLLAAIAQGLSLAVCLWLYSLFQPGYVYPIMAYCVLMILYLNSYEVRVIFLPRRDSGASVEG
jgi:small-conductance mechanosensitive channel